MRRRNGTGTLIRRKQGGPWIAQYYDAGGRRRQRSTRTTSRSDAERLLTAWTERAILERQGLVAPEGGTHEQRMARLPFSEHLQAFDHAKRAEGVTDRHREETVVMINKVASACRWSTLADVKPGDAERFAGDIEGTPRTRQKYLTALKTFTRWCVADGRLPADPLARVKKPTPQRVRERRFLRPEEWAWLSESTEDGPDRHGMSGADRRLLYELGIETGLRSGELRSLRASDLHLDRDRPLVLVPGTATKNSKPAKQFVRAGVATQLRALAERMGPGVPLFNMPPKEHVATMLRKDLTTARDRWLEHGGLPASDFLLAEDSSGRVLDFHALRHTCGAWAAMGGASPKALQTLMRHSKITLTLDTYGHLLPDEAAETVHLMPHVPPPNAGRDGEPSGTTDDHSLADDGNQDGQLGQPEGSAAVAAGAGRNAAIQDDAVRDDSTKKPLRSTQGPFSSEADGTRTRNHRIDSPGL